MVAYPVGQQDFKGIIEGEYVYADKTSFIREILEEKGKYYFLSRPRRFGKSLFLSTLEYFFLGERDLFKNLAIDSYSWNWESHAVVHLDLNGATYTDSKTSLINKLEEQLKDCENRYSLPADNTDLCLRFEKLITGLYKKTGRQVVVLIDEYEKPVLEAIGNKNLLESYRNILSGFYGVLKSSDKYLKLVFLTGVTKFGKMSVFSALNNIHDISLEDKYGAICGITESELTSNFQEGIEKIASRQEISLADSIKLLKLNYDGYHFSSNCPDIFNPYSLLTAFRNGQIGAYWSETGTPTLLAKLLVRRNYNLENLDGIRATREMLMDVGYEFDEPASLFYQTGYLTIKSYDKLLNTYTLGFPNREVEVAFFNYLLPYYLKSKSEHSSSFIIDFAEGINYGNPVKAMNALEAFTAGINYDIIPKPELERHFQQIMYVFSRLILPYADSVTTEEHTSDGRIDMTIKTKDFIYIIEIKRDTSSLEALNQIKEKKYHLQFETDPRKIFLIGINFSTESRRIENYEIEELGS